MITIVVCLSFFISLFMVNKSIVEQSHNYQPQSIISFDGKYILQTHKIEDDTSIYATFSVELQDTQQKIFNCSDRYRTADLKLVSWVDNTLDIIVKSGDVGSISYQFVNDTWKKQ